MTSLSPANDEPGPARLDAPLSRRQWLLGTGGLVLASHFDPTRAMATRAGAPHDIRADFPIAEQTTYLNNARWHPLSTTSRQAVETYLEYKARGGLDGGGYIEEMQESVKASFAKIIHARPSEISYVPSTMVAENLVIAGLGIPRSGGNVVTDALHFEGSTYLYRSLEARGLDLRVVMPHEWRIDLHDLERRIDHNTTLVSLSLVSSANGFQHDLHAVCDLAHAHGAMVYADIVQAAGAVPVDVHASGVDFCACASYKWLMGDMGLGFFYVPDRLQDVVLKRTQYGHRQYANFADHIFPYQPPAKAPATWDALPGAGPHYEVGTISNTTVACLTQSLDFIQRLGVEQIQQHNHALTQRLQREVPRLGFDPLTPLDCPSPIVSFSVKDTERVAKRLAQSKVDVKVDQHVMRVSPSIYNDERDIDALLTALS